MAAATLPQRRDVVEDPEPATMRSHDEIVVLNNQIAHRSRRQIQSQRLPIRAVIERHINAFFGCRRTGALCVPDLRELRLRFDPSRDPVHDFRPRFAAVVRRKNVRAQIVDP